ncbi:CD82 antigen [Agrilus planipennis]|uniref:Tetraspanin n=1 Tax=Agrilus planipennis TaxID=224129 RepID=A0A7F5QYR9_AGRPL|nr:CD82 antigen [Agrilus planipennis]
MVYDCGACIAKYVLCFFNFVIFFALNLFIYLFFLFQQFTQPTVIEQASYILIAAGAFMFIVSFLGYCGALRESRCLLTTYGICLVIILILEVTAGGLAAAYKGKADLETRNFLKSTISKYYAVPEKADAVTLMWNHLQAQLSCCGVDDYRDFDSSPKWVAEKGRKQVPESCCVLEGDKTLFKPTSPYCTTSPSESNSYYQKGCYEALQNWMKSHLNIVIGVGIGLGLLQLLGIFFAFCLCRSIDGYIK